MNKPKNSTHIDQMRPYAWQTLKGTFNLCAAVCYMVLKYEASGEVHV